MTVLLRFGNQIRLTRREAEVFKEITDFEPGDIQTLCDLEAYVDSCKRFYVGTSYATQFLHSLIDAQYARCVTGQVGPGLRR